MRKIVETLIAGVLAVLIVFVFTTLTVKAQKPQTFELNEKMADNVYVCMTQDEAIKFAEAMVMSLEAARAVFKEAACSEMTAFYTYLRLVHQTGGINVYEAKWGNRRVYVLTEWSHARMESEGGDFISPHRRVTA